MKRDMGIAKRARDEAGYLRTRPKIGDGETCWACDGCGVAVNRSLFCPDCWDRVAVVMEQIADLERELADYRTRYGELGREGA